MLGFCQVVVASFLPNIGSPIEPKQRKLKSIVKLSSPIAPPLESRADLEHQNFNEHVHESPAPPTRNFQFENHTTASVHDWRRTATDMNVSLTED